MIFLFQLTENLLTQDLLWPVQLKTTLTYFFNRFESLRYVRSMKQFEEARSGREVLDAVTLFLKHISSICGHFLLRSLFLHSLTPPAAGPGTQRRNARDKKNGRKNRNAFYRYIKAIFNWQISLQQYLSLTVCPIKCQLHL